MKKKYIAPQAKVHTIDAMCQFLQTSFNVNGSSNVITDESDII